LADGTPRSIGGYLIEGELGRGGMGVVYRARHPSLPGRSLALKVLEGAAEDPDARARFGREMQALAAASRHPGVVKILAGNAEGSDPFFVMELVDGPSLERHARGKGLEPREAARLLLEVARTTAQMHAQGILHRDLKPQNVFLSSDGRVLVGDFGLARIVGGNRLTQTQTSLGTPGYSAPEQLDGSLAQADVRADVYALGATLSFALTGRAPFEGGLPQILAAIYLKDAPPPSRAAARVPLELDAICLRALERQPERRYATAEEFARELERFLEGKPVEAAAAERARRRRRRIVRATIAIAATASLVVATVLLRRQWIARQDHERLMADLRAALDANVDAPRLERELESLRARGAGGAELGPLVKRVAERALDEAARSDDARLTEERLALFQKVAGPALDGLAVRARAILVAARARALEGDLASSQASTAAITSLAAAAEEASREVDLVGESPGSRAVFDLLLEAGAACGEQRDAAAKVEKLATARLREQPSDPAGRALRAYAKLARAGAPLRALGPGVLGTVEAQDATVLGDLEQARGLPGGAGARAAWLLVELRLSARDRDDAALKEALDAARSRAGDAPEREDLERLAALEPTAASFRILRDEIPKDPVRACVRLSRFLARCGAPSAIEHPELANANLATLRLALRHEPLERYEPVPPSLGSYDASGVYRVEAQRLVEDNDAHAPDVGPEDEHRQFLEQFRRMDQRLEKLLAEGLARAPDDGALLSIASSQYRGYFSPPALRLVAQRSAVVRSFSIEELYSPDDRQAIRGQPTSVSFWGPEWDLDGKRGLAAVTEFERRVRHDTLEGGDPIAKLALEHGLDRKLCEDAVAASAGLKALEEITPSFPRDKDSPLDEHERPELELRAALGLEAYARLGSSSVLPFRARWSRLVVPAPWGRSLAAVDFVRVARLGCAPLPPARGSWAPPSPSWVLLDAALEAADLDRESELRRELARELYQESTGWLVEDELRQSFEQLRVDDRGDVVRDAGGRPVRLDPAGKKEYVGERLLETLNSLGLLGRARELRDLVPEVETFPDSHPHPEDVVRTLFGSDRDRDLTERASRPSYVPPTADSPLLSPPSPSSSRP
jgi:predicted Ser/Thr protein kinase